jgi:3-dehydroquinate synthase
MNIALIGYRGAGKSTLGKLLAQELNKPFIDIDNLIERDLNQKIQVIFKNKGETTFRKIERKKTREILENNDNAIIACGGGIIVDKRNIFELKSKASVCYLDIPKGLIHKRIANSDRPALCENLTLQQEIERTLQERQPLYEQCADTIIRLLDEKINQSLEKVREDIPRHKKLFETTTVQVKGNKLADYSIVIKRGLAKDLQNYLPKKTKFLIICDSNIKELYGKSLQEQLTRNGLNCELVYFPAGEKNKTIDTFDKLHEKIALRLDRQSAIIALGGGVTGDLAGFVAATYMRGIPFIQVPTSLLAMVDSSIGGKLGVNTSKGKNCVGLFCNPMKVLIDPLFLHTLPQDFLNDGLAEVIKHAIISDRKFFQFLTSNYQEILSLNSITLIEMISTSLRIKLSFVSRDEIESGDRRILNFGHTTGHALESLLGFEKISHGYAVALGMVVAGYLSVEKKLLDVRAFEKICQLLQLYNLPIKLSDLGLSVNPKELYQYLQYDKKKIDQKLHFILINEIGESLITTEITKQEIMKAIQNVL